MQDNREKLTIIAVNSTVIYLISFILFHFLFQFATGFAAVGNDLNAVVHYYGTDVLPGRAGWKKMPIIYTYITGPIFALFLAVVFKQLHFTRYKMRKGFMKLFMLWGFVHGMLFAIGSVIIGVIVKGPGSGIGVAFLWGRVPMGLQWGMMGVSVMVLVVLGFIVTKLFLQTSPTKDLIDLEYNSRPIYILCVAVIPWFVGSLLLFLINYPKYYGSNFLLWMLMVPVLIPIITFCKVNMRITLSKSRETLLVGWDYIIVCGIAILLFRLLLDSGLDMRSFR